MPKGPVALWRWRNWWNVFSCLLQCKSQRVHRDFIKYLHVNEALSHSPWTPRCHTLPPSGEHPLTHVWGGCKCSTSTHAPAITSNYPRFHLLTPPCTHNVAWHTLIKHVYKVNRRSAPLPSLCEPWHSYLLSSIMIHMVCLMCSNNVGGWNMMGE